MIIFSYWQLTNRQMFFNEVELKQYSNEIVKPAHVLFDYSKGIDHTIFLLMFIPLFIFWNSFLNFFIAVFRKVGLHKKKSDEVVFDENLGEYWDNLIGQEQKRWFTKDTHNRNQLNIG